MNKLSGYVMTMQQLTSSAAVWRVVSLNRSTLNVFSMMTKSRSTDSGTSTTRNMPTTITNIIVALVDDSPTPLLTDLINQTNNLFSNNIKAAK